jgi:hypothetical protein
MAVAPPRTFSKGFQTFSGLKSTCKAIKVNTPMHVHLIAGRKAQRRSALRYELKLPVIFYWNDGTEHAAGGFTSDVALDGALIASSVCPPIGCDVRIEVLIPSPDSSGEQLRIQCSGKITRAETRNGSSSFGVRGFFDDDHITRQIFK